MRRIIAHIEALPSDSAFVRTRRGMSGWSQEAFQLADIADELAALRYYMAALAGAQLQPPTPYPRPTGKPVADEPLTVADLNSFFGGV